MSQPAPAWLLVMVRGGKRCGGLGHPSLTKTRDAIKNLQLHTVCESARCPNRGACFFRGTATFMILGNICTRNCRFCAVDKGRPVAADSEEPHRLARAAANLKLDHVVVTSVTRDDLPDGGAGQFAAVIHELRQLDRPPTVEVLTPDFKGAAGSLKIVIDARPDVFGHNIETVPHLYREVRPDARYRRSLEVLEAAKLMDPALITKSGLMLGLGETEAQVHRVLQDLLQAGVDMLTIGQYLAPSLRHYPVQRYVPPEEYKHWEQIALVLGFKSVAAAPLVRSSYHAGDHYRSVVAHDGK